MVLIAPPPSNSIRYRPRLHQPAPSWTASTWGRKFDKVKPGHRRVPNLFPGRKHGNDLSPLPAAVEPPRGRMNEMKPRERP